MSRDNFFLFSFLPSLGDLSAKPPITRSDLLELLKEFPEHRLLCEVVFLLDDIEQYISFVAGEVGQPDLTVLAIAQLRQEEALPAYLSPKEGRDATVPLSDELFNAYFIFSVKQARFLDSSFLGNWIAREAGLRLALSAIRAKAGDAELETGAALAPVKELFSDAAKEYKALAREALAAGTPIKTFEILEQAAWQWLASQENWFSFSNDELGVYAARLRSMFRWQSVCGRRS